MVGILKKLVPAVAIAQNEFRIRITRRIRTSLGYETGSQMEPIDEKRQKSKISR
jgi:hypothetical protein